MADESTPGEQQGYSEALNLRHERFISLGGQRDIQMDMKAFTPLKELVTEQHRKIVFDLASSGISNQDVADIMGISKERLQELFDYEIKTAFQLCQASLARSLYFMGIAGDEKAATSWLKLHNRSKWASKTQVSGLEDGAPIKTEDTGSKAILAELLAGMATSQKLKRPEKKALPPKAATKPSIEIKPVKPRKALTVIKKPRQETT